ncbi:hypothetical protein KKC13_01990 [bacterium]|nr:hypothetical protein [bacterium]MBU1957647.1 hypothetical protein [bacterium]
MSVLIQSTIKTNPLGRWYIELNDISKENHMEICLSINEYAQKIEAIGAEYDNAIEIAWQSDDNVTPQQIHEVRMEMNAYEAEREAREATEAEGEQATHQADGTPVF